MDGSYAEWSMWLNAAKVEPVEDTLETHLAHLRQELSPGDWVALRQYLATTIRDRRTAQYSILDCPDMQSFDFLNTPNPEGARH